MSTIYTRRAIVIVDVDQIPVVRAKAQDPELDPEGDGGFDTPLSPSGLAPGTHMIVSWPMTEAQWAKSSSGFFGNSPKVRLWDGNVVTPEQALAEAGLRLVRAVH
jgi:hypothetical protein